MKFSIVGQDDSYGSHRFSNNVILELIAEHSLPSEKFKFVWWIEKVFLDKSFEKQRVELESVDWFGVAHVPLLTPKWAMYSQNDLAKLFATESWKKAIANCRGIICLSEHLAEQYKILYPSIPVFNLKHPMGNSKHLFSLDKFLDDPKMVVVGTWLRNFQKFLSAKSPYKKVILHTKYGKSFIRDQYARYHPSIHGKLQTVQNVSFLSDDDYDELLSSSLLFLGMHDTSANNAVCESIMSNTPFISLRHPAVEEYVGKDYPLFINTYEELDSLTNDKIAGAYNYLKDNSYLKEQLSYDAFINGFKEIFKKVK